nr:MAG: hypothetical protein [Sanya fiers-like virus 28]
MLGQTDAINSSLGDSTSNDSNSGGSQVGIVPESATASSYFHLDVPCSFAAWLTEFVMSAADCQPDHIEQAVQQVRRAGKVVEHIAFTFAREEDRSSALLALATHFGLTDLSQICIRDEIVSLTGE